MFPEISTLIIDAGDKKYPMSEGNRGGGKSALVHSLCHGNA